MTKVAGLIPARYESTRLPGKVLTPIGGKPMIQRVYERSAEARVLEAVLVATDDERIVDAVQAFGGRSVLTSADHTSGTDRLAEVVQRPDTGVADAEIVVNIQGDQPFIDPVMIEEAVRPVLEDPELPMATLAIPISEPGKLQDPSVVKVVVDQRGFALYFSRSLIPYPRKDVPHPVYEHVGLYVYRREFLIRYSRLEPTLLERVESLEQLRALENGHRIRVVATQCGDREFAGFSVDTEDELARAESMLQERGLA
jgi:3-deoxy-manno-octulosonate cytidylyltransferase (CMP-KDO synthetase)